MPSSNNIYNIYLVGFMGSGKSAVGEVLAKELKRSFVDIDDLIVKKERRSINDIFKDNGEPYFRKIEKETLKEISVRQCQVVACGGGIVLDSENIKVMKETGLLVALSASPEIILKRTKKYAHRPLLNVEDPDKRISELLKERQPYYAKANFLIDTSDLSIKEVVDDIMKRLKDD